MTKLKSKLLISLSLACAVLTITLLVNISNNTLSIVSAQQSNKAQNQDDQRKKGLKLDRSADVIDEAAKPTSTLEATKRNDKNRRYDKKKNGGITPRKLTEFASGEGVTVASNEPEELSPLPVKQSEIIVSGTMTEAQPYLTESQTVMYTEFSFQIENILKDDTNGTISKGVSIKVDQESGAMRLTNGKTIYYHTAGTGKLPRVGKKYVLFLKRVNDGKDLAIITNYELRDGKVFSSEVTRVFSPGKGIVTEKSPFADITEADFLQIIRSAVANSESISNDGGSNQ